MTRRITYGQLLTQANKFGNSLRELGVEEGDRVILRTPNIPPALVANFAILKLGAVVTPTSPLFSRTEIAHVANDSEAVAIVVSAMLLGEVEAARENFKTVRDIIVIGGDVAEVKAKGFLPYAELVQAGSARTGPRASQARGCRLALIHLRHHRTAQGHGALRRGDCSSSPTASASTAGR